MKRLLILFVLTIATTDLAFGQIGAIAPYHSQNSFQLASPGALGVGLYGYENPAMLNYLHQPDLMFAWNTNSGYVRAPWNNPNQWGLFIAVPHLGFGVIHNKVPGLNAAINDYRISLGFGDKTFSSGFGYGWSTGDRSLFQRQNVFTSGMLIRPIRFASLGLMTSWATSGGTKEGVVDLAIRPLGTELLTLFTDYAIQNKKPYDKNTWSAGVAVEAIPGIRFTGRYFDSKVYTLGVQFSSGHAGISAQSNFDKSGGQNYSTYAVRMGAYDRNLLRKTVKEKKKYVEMNLLGELKYQKFLWFDKSNTLSGILNTIEAAKTDPAVAGIAINMSGMDANRELAWEVREKLKDFKSAGKHVLVYIDRGGIIDYYFATIADKIVLDPAGMISLEGFIMGRTFLKGTLDKLGIAYDEWRFFKYKSANETLSSDKMSEGDREQRQKLIDDLYRLVKTEICEARKITSERFDALVNDDFLLMPQDAVSAGLVDGLGRWDEVKNMIKKVEGDDKSFMRSRMLEAFMLPKDNYWGEKPQIAVIYALGECAMDQGIKARKLVKVVEKAANDKRIKAIVFRVDSPGGDGMASDIVAEALRNAKSKKPVIVSQGFVAASGGYWLSMYADTIVASPQTITGSIGVIGGWLYNNGLKEKMGMTTDFVKVGNHADLGFGFGLPFIGLGLPDRNMTPEERAKAERFITTFYKEFVTKVATGRKKSYDEIHAIAQGRVWSGVDGKQNGLVDVLGGLETAIQIAKDRAGLSNDPVTIIELPKPDAFNPSMFMPKLFGVEFQKNKIIEHIKFRLDHNGEPMPILPLEDTELQ